jgi:hypothetical protein
MTEYNINNVLNYLEGKEGQMNETDYLDALAILSQRLENENRVNFNAIEGNKSYVLLKNWATTNFSKYVTVAQGTFLNFLYQTQIKNLRVFSIDQNREIVKRAQEYLEERHKNINIVNFFIIKFKLYR